MTPAPFAATSSRDAGLPQTDMAFPHSAFDGSGIPRDRDRSASPVPAPVTWSTLALVRFLPLSEARD